MKIKNFFNKLFKSDNQKGLYSNIYTAMSGFFSTSTYDKTDYLMSYQKSLYVYACLKKIIEKVSSIDWKLYKIINSKGDVEEVYNNPLLDLIYKPNPLQTKGEFIEQIVLDKKLSGNAFILKIRNGRTISELWRLRPDKIQIKLNEETGLIKNYEYTTSNKTIKYEAEDIIHIKNTNPLDDLNGMSNIAPAELRIETEELANRYQRDFFLNNAQPDGVLSTDGQLTEKQTEQMRKQWEAFHKGVGKSSKMAVLQGGLKYQNIATNQKEMDFIEGIRLLRDDILTVFGVPKPIVAITDDVNRANADTAMYIFQSEVVKPTLKNIIEKINEQLVMEDFDNRFFFDFEDPTPEDRKAKVEEYNTSIQNGWRTINEVRKLEGLEPIKGGDEVYQPFSMAPITQGNISRVAEENKLVLHKTKRALFNGKGGLHDKMVLIDNIVEDVDKKRNKKTKSEEELKSSFTKEQKGVLKTSHEKNLDKNVKEFEGFIKGLLEGQKERLLKQIKIDEKRIDVEMDIDWDEEERIFKELGEPRYTQVYNERGERVAEIINGKYAYTQSAREFIEKKTIKFANFVNETTRKEVSEAIAIGIKEGESVREVKKRISEAFDKRINNAETIARTEMTSTVSAVDLNVYKENKEIVKGKEWIATLDDRVRDSHLLQDGETRKLNERFSNGLLHPGDINASGDEVCNCRCTLAPIVIK